MKKPIDRELVVLLQVLVGDTEDELLVPGNEKLLRDAVSNALIDAGWRDSLLDVWVV